MKNNFNFRIWSVMFISICGIWLLNACRTTETVTTVTSKNLKTEQLFYQDIQDHSIQYQHFSARFQLQLTLSSGKEMSSRAHLKIEKDCRLQISIQPLMGIEAFRIELTPDTIRMMDRLNKRFLLADYKQMLKEEQINFDYYNLQALLTNQLFIPGRKNLADSPYSHFQWEEVGPGYSLLTKDKNGLIYQFKANEKEKIYATEIRDRASEYILHFDYENFRPLGQQQFPYKLSGYMEMKQNTKHAFMLEFSKIEIDTAVDMNFDIPASYQPVSLGEILNFLKNT